MAFLLGISTTPTAPPTSLPVFTWLPSFHHSGSSCHLLKEACPAQSSPPLVLLYYTIRFYFLPRAANGLIYLRACIVTVCSLSLDSHPTGPGIFHVCCLIQNQEQCLVHGRHQSLLTHTLPRATVVMASWKAKAKSSCKRNARERSFSDPANTP